MYFTLSIDLMNEIKKMHPLHARRLLKDRFESIGCAPDVNIQKELVDKIHRGQISVIEGNNWNPNYIFIRVVK